VEADMSGDEAEIASAPRVVVIDDEEDITTFLLLALEDAGFAAAACNRPEEAHALLREFRPDLICLDLLMPGLTGATLYVEIREDPELAKVPVLILSGLSAREELAGLLRREADLPPPAGYIEKPVAADGFVRTVRSLLGRAGGGTAGPAPAGPVRRGKRGGGA
jgi:DNA-binding response OmpR family regulator